MGEGEGEGEGKYAVRLIKSRFEVSNSNMVVTNYK